ncbi:sugar ABC transporter ATP-binding protein [Amycolatopsis sp. GM8]|uniref:sugar ABC transporter ATP-binding protein n=1 Tax=Amycolatopsis sp. GM8 TaxID=2896530 RepID=UPI001F467084|nr:sugar ABC transporter ATP-binding protein [Amycolatopsis sp. GM8]
MTRSVVSGTDQARPLAAPLLAITDVHKSYGGVHALRGARLVVERGGVVHGVLGQNGSGKSTLLGVLSGQVRADRGAVVLDGRTLNLSSPSVALRHGIAMVSQENAVAPELSIAENMLMGGRLGGSPWRVSRRATERRARAALDALGLDYDPGWPVSRLRPDQRQMVEIARAMSLESRVLILDEPTSSLSDYEVERLFAAVRRLSTNEVSTIFVSHRLKEVFDIVDQLTVLRDGRTVAEGPIGEFTPESLVDAMVGETNVPADHTTRRDSDVGPTRLTVRGLRSAPQVTGVELGVASGEVVGMAGLSGCGRSELLECLFGIRRPDAGVVEVDGKRQRLLNPGGAIRAGVGFLPPDRKTQGLVLDMSVEDNLRMVSTHRRPRLGRPGRHGGDRTTVERIIRDLQVRTPSPATPVVALSGGNQQKVALGKWLAAGSRLLLLDEPTRGVDAAARADIHRLLREFAADGGAVLVSSSENDELLEVCDRIVVFFRGRVTAVLDARRADEAQIAHYAGGLE